MSLPLPTFVVWNQKWRIGIYLVGGHFFYSFGLILLPTFSEYATTKYWVEIGSICKLYWGGLLYVWIYLAFQTKNMRDMGALPFKSAWYLVFKEIRVMGSFLSKMRKIFIINSLLWIVISSVLSVLTLCHLS